jgi:hypothetical protein
MALRAEFRNAIWWDQDLQTGGEWSQEIDTKLSSAACVVVLWSKLSVESQWVQQEAAVAKALGTLAPAQIEDCVIPTPYAGVQAARLIGWQGNENDAEFVKLVSRVRLCLENNSSSRASAPQLHSSSAPTQAKSSIRSRIEDSLVMWTLGSLLAGFLAGFGVYEAILKTAQLEVVPSSTVKRLESEVDNLKKEKANLESKLATDKGPTGTTLVVGQDPQEPPSPSPSPVDVLLGRVWRVAVFYGTDQDHEVRSEQVNPTELYLDFIRGNDGAYVVGKPENGRFSPRAAAEVSRSPKGTGLHIKFRLDTLIPSGSSPFCMRALSSHGAQFELEFDPDNPGLSGRVLVAAPGESVDPYTCAFVDPA